MNTTQKIHSILQDIITTNNVRLLAIDFDATIIQVHTYGAWRGTAQELSTHVRPVFIKLLQYSLTLRDYGLYVSIVTFSAQKKLIRQVLAIILGSEELANRVIIRCNDMKWEWPRGFEQAGKQGHIGSVLQHILTTNQLEIPLSQVLLIDDDTRNIDIAKESGMRTAVFPVIEIPEPGSSTYAVVVDEGSRLIDSFVEAFEVACTVAL